MFYFDTSFVAPLFLQEVTSDVVAAFMQNIPAGQLAVSYWTQVEFSSLLARRVRMQDLTEEVALQTLKNFENALINSYFMIMPTVEDFELATQLLQHHHTGLRGGDALHLAISKNHDAECLYSLDRGLVKAASSLKIIAKMGIKVAK